MENDKPLHIWFNRSFATSYWLIKMIRENADGRSVSIFATHVDPSSPVLQAADHAGKESTLDGDDYIKWCIDYCAKNAIDVFIPRNNIDLIAENIDVFTAAGIKVLASSHESIRLLGDKNLTYQKAQEIGVPVPPWRVAHTEQTIREAVVSLTAEVGSETRIVVKPTVGVGAQGFRVLTHKPFSIDDLLIENDDVAVIDLLRAYRRAEDEGREAPELMLLPWLDAPEVSVDCLSDQDGKLVKFVPRTKDGDRLTRLSNRFDEVVPHIEKIHEHFDLRYLTNTQFRWWQDELVLLETNTRASGGLYSTSLSGVNLIWEAIMLATEGKVDYTAPQLNKAYISLDTFVEVHGVV